jgi:hypothetical protein
MPAGVKVTASLREITSSVVMKGTQFADVSEEYTDHRSWVAFFWLLPWFDVFLEDGGSIAHRNVGEIYKTTMR